MELEESVFQTLDYITKYYKKQYSSGTKKLKYRSTELGGKPGIKPMHLGLINPWPGRGNKNAMKKGKSL